MAVLITAACGKAPEATQSGMAPPAVSVAEVIEQPVTEWDELTGRLEAPESVEIRPRVSGFIDKVAFEEGALVKKGDLLFQIDPRPFQAEVKRLQAQLQQARATQQRTVAEAERGERLRQKNAISAELADARVSAASEAKSAVAAIQAAGQGPAGPVLHSRDGAHRRPRRPRADHLRQPGQCRRGPADHAGLHRQGLRLLRSG